MPTRDDPMDAGQSSKGLARRALWFALVFAWLGAAMGLVGARLGTVSEKELLLVSASLLFSTGAIITLGFFRRVGLQTIATASTIFFAVNLCTGMVIAVSGTGEHLNLFVYLIWFFPLLAFNKLVNRLEVGRFFARFLLIAPLSSIACLSPWFIANFKTLPLILLTVFCLCYGGFGLMFDIVTRYREEFVAERERAQSLRQRSDILDSISDCFISLDENLHLGYLNDAACEEFGADRRLALNESISHVAPDFWSSSMQDGIQQASGSGVATSFEAEGVGEHAWYHVRCYPRLGGISVYFRNITDSILSRRQLEDAHKRLREQAELLDKAKDAIYVVAEGHRISYWNKGAETLYGWSSSEVLGSSAIDIFDYEPAEYFERRATLNRDGQWVGEVSQCRRDRSMLIVEQHLTLVTGVDCASEYVLSINTDITKRKAAEAKVEHLAFYDTLTDLPNRQLLRQRLEKAIEAVVHRKAIGAILLIDLDDFMSLNDTLGHDTGDLLLHHVARRLMNCALTANTVARSGGDEFVVLMDDLSTDQGIAIAAATAAAEVILGAFVEPYCLGSHTYEVTTSIGIALFSSGTAAVDEVLKQADLALYRAKAQGVNTMCFFDSSMEAAVASRVALRSDLRKAMENREFELHYQPQISNNGRVVSAEALLRWRHPSRGMVPPNDFIPLAEEAGLIVALGRWVLETACRQLAEWARRMETERLSLAVNVSLRQFLDAQFVGTVLDVLQTSGANPCRLKLEITESSIIKKVDETIAKMEALRGCGIGFSLDDFGTGYSSLSHLRRLPLDQLKIDRSFIVDSLANDKDASVVRTIIALGKNLNLTVIAEGVETEEQREFLEGEGCFFYQGFLYSRALAPRDFEAFVAQSWISAA